MARIPVSAFPASRTTSPGAAIAACRCFSATTTVAPRGDVTFHEGYVTTKEARKLERGEAVEKPVRPEVSAPIQNYVDLHRHAAVSEGLGDGSAWPLRPFVQHILPMVTAARSNDDFTIISILRAESPCLEPARLRGDRGDGALADRCVDEPQQPAQLLHRDG